MISPKTLVRAVAGLLLPAFAVAQSVKTPDEATALALGRGAGWHSYWHEGFHLDSAGGRSKIKLAGRFMLDGAIIDPDQSTREAFADLAGVKAQIRRIRFYAQGTLDSHFEWKAQFDFYQWPDILYKDIYVGVKNVPYFGTIRIGHLFEPFSLEEDTSTKFITLMERSLPTLAFYPSRNTGVIAYNTALNQRLWWGAGASIEADDNTPFDFRGNTGWNLSGRLVGLPWYGSSARLLHVGLGYMHKFRSVNTDEHWQIQLKPPSPEVNLAEPLIDTGKLVSTGADYFSPELALVAGPFSLQGEYLLALVNRDRDMGDDLSFQGYYLNVSYFLTGESRVYDRSEASFGTVKPLRNFSLKSGSGWGAWQLALRYSTLDLNDREIRGGAQRNVTFGVNWQLDPYQRVMFNYVHIHVDETELGSRPLVDGNTDVYMMRYQIAL